MIGFLFAAAAVVALVLGLLLRPLFGGKSAAAQASHRQLNAAIYRDQLAKLKLDRAENMIGEEDYLQAQAELQLRVLQDTGEAESVATLRAPKRTMLGIAIALPLAAAGFYLLLGNPGAIDPPAAAHPAAEQDFERMVSGLAQKLEKDPDNLKGWAMLARSYKALERPLEAEKAYDRAGAYLDGDAQLLAEYADLAATNAGGKFAGKPMQLIEKALKVDPNNTMALWLAGTAAFKLQDYDQAIGVWSRLLQQLPPDSDDARTLQGAVNEARAKGGKAAPAGSGKTGKSGAAGAPTGNASVSGKVELDPALAAKAAPGDVVMIIARAPGMRIPVAVMRAHVSSLPLDFKLDDSLSMTPEARISAAGTVEVEARISKSGMAQPEAGDLLSPVQTAKVGARDLRLRVDRVRP
ncbi:MAG TPA: c-type cytochrome biogenesis protein CcmI [Burkholderiaceae bacterium]|nr:c-type cytochrome biogenesis protein CcmI [Burkholderiaceae bacterium]